MIKTKKDAQNLLDEIRAGKIIQYTKNDYKITIEYNDNKFNVIHDGFYKGTGEYAEIAIRELIFLDRKYINKTK